MNNIEFTTINRADNKIINNNRVISNNSKLNFMCNKSSNKIINTNRNIVLGAKVSLWK